MTITGSTTYDTNFTSFRYDNWKKLIYKSKKPIIGYGPLADRYLIEKNSHPNLKVISKIRDEKTKKLKNYISIDQIRNLQSFISHSSIYDLPKIIIIDSADDLNLSSSNALLKILEEPNKNSFFFLISHQISKLTPTIRSRCIKFKINTPSFIEFKNIVSHENSEINEDEIIFLFNLSKGSPGAALELFSQNINQILNNFIKICENDDPYNDEILHFSSEIKKYNNEQFSIFLMIIKFILSNIIKINLGIVINKKINSELTNGIHNLSKILFSSTCLKILNYINSNEKDLFTFNLDKKIFTINLFAQFKSN